MSHGVVDLIQKQSYSQANGIWPALDFDLLLIPEESYILLLKRLFRTLAWKRPDLLSSVIFHHFLNNKKMIAMSTLPIHLA